MDRYHRQSLLPFIGPAGQAALGNAHVLLIGCGALGGTVAELLCRAGVGRLVLVDRDWVELTNLQRQVLFDEFDARDATPKAVAAARRLAAINSSIRIEPHVTDVHPGTIETLAGVGSTPVGAIIDATDNVDTRYLINDVSIKHGIPWVYGGCVSAEARVMTIRPGRGPCLRCVFRTPPRAGEIATCDTVGVLGPAASIVASFQAVAAMKLILDAPDTEAHLIAIDVWQTRFSRVNVGEADPACPCCGQSQFEYLHPVVAPSEVSLCGRNAVQLRPPPGTEILLSALADRLAPAGTVKLSRFLLRFTPAGDEALTLTLFPDGRAIVQGTADAMRARTLLARYLAI